MKKALLLVDVQDYWADKNPETTQRIKDNLEVLRQVGMDFIWVYA